MRKMGYLVLGLGMLIIAVAAYPVVAQSQGQQPGQPGPMQRGQPGQPAQPGQPGERPVVSATDFQQMEQQGMVALSQAIQEAESQAKGKAVAVIPVMHQQGDMHFNVYTIKDGQLTLTMIDCKTGRMAGQRQTNQIAELSMTRYVGHEEEQRPGGGAQPVRP